MTTRIVILNTGPSKVQVDVESMDGQLLQHPSVILMPGTFIEPLYVHLYQRIVVTEL